MIVECPTYEISDERKKDTRHEIHWRCHIRKTKESKENHEIIVFVVFEQADDKRSRRKENKSGSICSKKRGAENFSMYPFVCPSLYMLKLYALKKWTIKNLSPPPFLYEF